MSFSVEDALEYIKDNDIKFVRLAFCNLFGAQKNIAIMSNELKRAFEHGICVDTSAAEGFVPGGDGVFLYPDPSTLSMLPWRPSQSKVSRLYCAMRRHDGTPSPEDGRDLLRRALDKLAKVGYRCKIGSECEFYLFKLDDAGNPTSVPHDNAGYCDFAPWDKGENVRREICLALVEMGVIPESSHHERGPGQNEVVLRYCDPLQAADALVSFHAVTEIIAARNGLFASFNPKPLPDKHGNSVHINISVHRRDANLFEDAGNAEAESFMAGILSELGDITLFLNATPESFMRFGGDILSECPLYGTNHTSLARLPSPENGFARLELRSPDTSLSPYFAFSLIIEAGFLGINRSLKLSDVSSDAKPPKTLGDAIALAEKSEFVSSIIPKEALVAYVAQKRAEFERGGRLMS